MRKYRSMFLNGGKRVNKKYSPDDLAIGMAFAMQLLLSYFALEDATQKTFDKLVGHLETLALLRGRHLGMSDEDVMCMATAVEKFAMEQLKEQNPQGYEQIGHMACGLVKLYREEEA